VSLVGSIRTALGEDGLQRVIDARTDDQACDYRAAVPEADDAPLRDRLDALARRRTAEGYMAEVADGGEGTLLLVENHCPICDAAQACLGLCRSELDLFRRTLGDGVRVERVEHLLSGGRRCVYRITPAPESLTTPGTPRSRSRRPRPEREPRTRR
jgi:predicted ArsR family transcriptional regulator